MNDRQLETPEARAWRDAYRAGMQAGSDACPGDETLAAFVLDHLGADERTALADHITTCRRCAADYRTLRALRAEAQRGLRRGRRMRWPAVAAAAVLAAGLALTLVWLGRAPTSPDSGDAVRGGTPLEAAMHPADGALLDAPPASFSWPVQAGATEYRVRLYDETAELLWEGPATTIPSARLPPEVASRLAAGEAYFWTVEVAGVVTRPLLGPSWFRVEE